MIELTQTQVEDELLKIVEEVNGRLKIGGDVNVGCRPGNIGFSSQVLVDIMIQVEGILGVNIPNNAYIFYDKSSHKQLSIKEAAKKLLKVAKNGNK